VEMLLYPINFAIVIAFLAYFLRKPMAKMLKARSDGVEDEINSAAKGKKSAEELKQMYAQKVKDIEDERAAILEEARKLADDKRLQILNDAKAHAHEMKEKASRDAANELEQVKNTVYQSIVDISAEMAADLITATIDGKTHEKLFAQALVELEETNIFNAEPVATA